MKKVKALHIIPSFGIGGAEKLVLDYLYYSKKSAIDIMVISLYPNSNTVYDDFIRKHSLNVVYLNKSYGFDLSIIWQIEDIVKKWKPDIIHTHLSTLKYAIYSTFKNNVQKRFHTIHNSPEKDCGILDRLLNRFAFKYLGWIPIALTNKQKILVDNYYNINKTIVLNNGIDVDKYNNNNYANKVSMRKLLGIDEKALVLGHIGRFTKQKNHELIIDIFNRVNSIIENSYLLLIGNGELYNQVKQKVKLLNLVERVKFLGTRDDIPELLSAMDVFIFPSLYEGLPLSLLEAQAAGLKCVISDNIDKDVIVSERTLCLSLNEPLDKWCEYILNEEIKVKPAMDLYQYDIKNIIKKLEMLYSD